MKLKSIMKLILLGILASCHSENSDDNLIQYVDPFIGTGNHGHTYPGVTLPFGMVQLSPDTRTEGWDACSGYHYSDGTIMGFSMTHLSGTGIGDYGDILMMPYAGKVSLDPGIEDDPASGYRSSFRKSEEKASPGYYRVLLDDYKILVELSATNRTGIQQFTYPESDNAGVIIDLEHSINRQKNISLFLTVINEQEIEGLKYTSGWAVNHYVYFRTSFSKKVSFELYKDDVLQPGMNHVEGNNIKARVKFTTRKNEKILVKTALSATGCAGAASNLQSELPHWNFSKVVSDAQNEWNKHLAKIKIKNSSGRDKKIFYTALYHASLAPNLFSDVDGRYRGMDQKIHQSDTAYYTVFSLWDTYRAEHPLLTIIDPELDKILIYSLLKKDIEGGILPKWDLASNYTGTMIGSHAIPVIVDAIMKNIMDYDTDALLNACNRAIEYDSTDMINYPSEEVKNQLMPGSKLLDIKYGYIPCDLEKASVSQGLEFAYNNWCIAILANTLGKKDTAMEFFKRSQHYKAYFDTSTGFMRGRKVDGTFEEPFDPKLSEHWKTSYAEGNAWQWSWYVPHDVEGLISLYGGNENFASKLDSLFSTDSDITGSEVSKDITGLIGQYAHGNEPSHHIASLYSFAGKPWKTQELVHQIRNKFYSDKPDGLCGNEDCGQMSAWYILNALGLYPVCPGDNKYYLGTPLFDEVTIPVSNDKNFTILARNRSCKNIYVKRVLLNDKVLTTPFITHSDITDGKVLIFEMSDKQEVFWDNK